MTKPETEWVRVPRELSRGDLERIAAYFGYTVEEVAEMFPEILARISSAPAAPVGEVGELLRTRDGHDFDGEVHLTSAEAAAIYAGLSSLQQENEALKAANEALMRERTSLIETKRQQIERLKKERDEAIGKLALIIDRVVYSDSYGVPGSDFSCCHLCNAGGAPGIPFEHETHCPVLGLGATYEQWFDDISATEDALRETEDRASAAEARLKQAEDVIRPFALLGATGCTNASIRAARQFLENSNGQ
jgi:hypothetical protein